MKTQAEIEEALTKALPVDQIKTTDGVFGEFIEGWYAKKVANDVFGPLGWSTETMKMDRANAGTGNLPEYVSKSRITVQYWTQHPDGEYVKEEVVREGTGAGSGNKKDPYELAVKEAETDAIKRALSTFGTRFGLSLYQGNGKGQFEIGSSEWFGDEQKGVLRNKFRELNLDPKTTRNLYEKASQEQMTVKEAVELFEEAAEE